MRAMTGKSRSSARRAQPGEPPRTRSAATRPDPLPSRRAESLPRARRAGFRLAVGRSNGVDRRRRRLHGRARAGDPAGERPRQHALVRHRGPGRATVLLLLVAGAVGFDGLPRRLRSSRPDLVRGLAIAALAALVVAHALTVTDLIAISAIVGAADAFFSPPTRPSSRRSCRRPSTSRATPSTAPARSSGGRSSARRWRDAHRRLRRAGSGRVRRRRGELPRQRPVRRGDAARPAPQPSGRSMLADAAAGLRWTRSQPWLWWTSSPPRSANGSPRRSPPPRCCCHCSSRDTLHQGPTQYGLVFAAGGLGGRRRLGRRHPVRFTPPARDSHVGRLGDRRRRPSRASASRRTWLSSPPSAPSPSGSCSTAGCSGTR